MAQKKLHFETLQLHVGPVSYTHLRCKSRPYLSNDFLCIP